MEHEILSLPTDEAHKDFDLVFQVADALERFGINRCRIPGTASFGNRNLHVQKIYCFGA